jgi:cell filamentation protein
MMEQEKKSRESLCVSFPGTVSSTKVENLLGITSKREMDRIEGQEQIRALEKLVKNYGRDHRFTAADVCRIHKTWLGKIYSWAGKYRQVNLMKDNFSFAAALQVSKLMQAFEQDELRAFTPCRPTNIEDVAKALAVVHVELVLIHPFREGNGRVARILAVLMGLQAGLPSLYFENLSGKRREQYFSAIRAGRDRN